MWARWWQKGTKEECIDFSLINFDLKCYLVYKVCRQNISKIFGEGRGKVWKMQVQQ